MPLIYYNFKLDSRTPYDDATAAQQHTAAARAAYVGHVKGEIEYSEFGTAARVFGQIEATDGGARTLTFTVGEWLWGDTELIGWAKGAQCVATLGAAQDAGTLVGEWEVQHTQWYVENNIQASVTLLPERHFFKSLQKKGCPESGA